MIDFYSQNVDGKWVHWQFEGAYDIMDELFSDDADIPSFDDPVRGIMIGRERVYLDAFVDGQPTFLDLCTLLDIKV